MRHAKSDWSSGVANDFDRPLNSRGRAEAEKIGKYMSEQGLQPEKIVCSPAVRASETASYIQSALNIDESRMEYEPRLYMGVPGETLKIITDNLKQNDSLLIVSHNPLLDQLLSMFWQDTELPYTPTGKLVTTANLLRCELSGQLDVCVTELTVESKMILRPKEIS